MSKKSVAIVVLLISFLVSVGYCFQLSSQKNKLEVSLRAMTIERDNLLVSNKKLKIVSIGLASAIDNLNNSIDEAKQYAWGTYNEMGDALDSLETQ